MSIEERIKKEIAIQKSIEGELCDDKLLLEVLSVLRTESQWNTLINTKLHSYGKYSYQSHRFYYPTKELLNLMKICPQ